MSTEETALATIETVKEGLSIARFVNRSELFKPEVINPILDAYEANVRAIVLPDVNTAKGLKERISLAAAVCSAKTGYDKEREIFLKDLRETVTTTNKSAGKVWERLEALQHEIRQPATDRENAEKARIAKIEADISEIEGAGTYTQSNWQSIDMDAMRERLREIGDCSGRNWDEFARRAALAIETSYAQITVAIAQREKYDAEQAELEQLRKDAAERAAKEEAERKEREEKARAEAFALVLVKEAEEKAAKEKREAEAKAEAVRLRIENEARQATEKAEREAREAEERTAKALEFARLAAEKAESDRIAAEQKAEQDKQNAIQAERERIERENRIAADALAARERDKKHRARIHGDILKVLSGAGFDESTGKVIIELIAKGKLPHVAIQY